MKAEETVQYFCRKFRHMPNRLTGRTYAVSSTEDKKRLCFNTSPHNRASGLTLVTLKPPRPCGFSAYRASAIRSFL
jgi:hypothetical protein